MDLGDVNQAGVFAAHDALPPSTEWRDFTIRIVLLLMLATERMTRKPSRSIVWRSCCSSFATAGIAIIAAIAALSVLPSQVHAHPGHQHGGPAVPTPTPAVAAVNSGNTNVVQGSAGDASGPRYAPLATASATVMPAPGAPFAAPPAPEMTMEPVTASPVGTTSTVVVGRQNLTMTTSNSSQTFLIGCTKALILDPELQLFGRGVNGGRVVIEGGSLATDRLGIIPDPDFPELANASDISTRCPGLVPISFATMSENGLILRGPAPASVFQSCMRRIFFYQVPPGPNDVTKLGQRTILFEAWALPNGVAKVNGTGFVDVAIPFAACPPGSGCPTGSRTCIPVQGSLPGLP